MKRWKEELRFLQYSNSTSLPVIQRSKYSFETDYHKSPASEASKSASHEIKFSFIQFNAKKIFTVPTTTQWWMNEKTAMHAKAGNLKFTSSSTQLNFKYSVWGFRTHNMKSSTINFVIDHKNRSSILIWHVHWRLQWVTGWLENRRVRILWNCKSASRIDFISIKFNL